MSQQEQEEIRELFCFIENTHNPGSGVPSLEGHFKDTQFLGTTNFL